jgi:hypothetical protein
MRYFGAGRAEVSMQWTRPDGRACKGRVDWLTEIDGRPVIVGLKTARDCRHFVFAAQAARLAYHWQWAFYEDGFTSVVGARPDLVEIVVESSAPHAIAVYRIGEDTLDQGREEYEAGIAKLAECEASNEWPGPVPTEETLSLPTWAYTADDDGDGVGDLGLEAD